MAQAKLLTLKEKLLPLEIWNWVWDTVAEISDEVGTEEKGKYLLAYEGWGSICVSCEEDPKKSDEENEAAYYKYARDQSDEVIKEWVSTYKKTYRLIESGYEPTGLYGVTWALFVRSKSK